MSPDPWTALLDWLTTVLVPSWGELIALLPYVVIGTIVGPFLTLILLMWAWHLVKRRRGRVRRGQPEPQAALVSDDGRPVFPPNTPYCEKHRLVYPARAKRCEIDGDDLSVSCPVDGTVRDIEIDTCSACGTKYKLGAGTGSAVILASDGPPEGGAAVA